MNTIKFDIDTIKAVAVDMVAHLHMPMQTEPADFAAMHIEQRIMLIKQLLMFFNCTHLYKALVEKNELEHIAELILPHINNGSSHELCFKTSGSTGEPLLHKHSVFSLCAEAMAFNKHVGNIQRVVSVVPCYHLFGCSFTIILPAILKIPVMRVPLLAISGIMDELCDGDMLVGFPLFWLHLCELQRCFKQKVYGLTSTGPCPPRVFDELGQLGISSLYEIYGSSETGAAGLRRHYKDNFKLLGHWQKYDGNTLQRTTISGATEKITLPDNVSWIDEHNFTLIERKDKAVQVGGSNIYPRQIAKIIEMHPAVKLCRVRMMDESEGNRLKAFVVPIDTRDATSSLRNELISWCRQRLSPAQRPRSFTFGDILPVNQLGKEANWNIS